MENNVGTFGAENGLISVSASAGLFVFLGNSYLFFARGLELASRATENNTRQQVVALKHSLKMEPLSILPQADANAQLSEIFLRVQVRKIT